MCSSTSSNSNNNNNNNNFVECYSAVSSRRWQNKLAISSIERVSFSLDLNSAMT